MSMRNMLEREAYVAIHAQSWRFRVVKYVVLVLLAAGMAYAKGWQATGVLFVWLFVLALVVHFVFRWKTKAWTQSWGPYKKLDFKNYS